MVSSFLEFEFITDYTQIVHLKRFALINGHYEKNETAVKFDPQRFDAKPYLHEAASKEKTIYKLYAATVSSFSKTWNDQLIIRFTTDV